jgi:mRNA interferase MazF
VLRGEIYYVDLEPVRGREQGGFRPVLVVSSDGVNQLPLVVIVVPGTDGANVKREFPTNVRIPAGEGGLSLETVFLCFQVRALDPKRFRPSPLGRLSAKRMKQIDGALRYSLDLRP